MARLLTATDVIAIHARILREAGQTPHVRDHAALEGAVARPAMAAHYGDADLFLQVALLIDGIARAHPFVDDNKRAALAAGAVTLALAGYAIVAPPLAFAQTIEALVTGAVSLADIAAWLRTYAHPL